MQHLIGYNNKLKDRAKQMRNSSSHAEVALWSGLKHKQLGVRFVRQKMIGNYIVDFYCKELKFAIEVDDTSHDLKYEYDEQRTKILKSLGIFVLRVSNEEVLKNAEGVVLGIKNYLRENYNRG